MTLEKLSISGAYLATHKVFPDERGVFREWFKSEEILTIDNTFSVYQANFSKSKKWVIRGIHYSVAPQGQSKIVTCASGEIVDVLIDLRVGSPTYLQVEYIKLSDESGKVIYIPTGIGHGFIVTSDLASIVYLTSSKFAPEFEKAICPTDPDLGITWPLPFGKQAIVSRNDQEAQKLSASLKSGSLPKFAI
jgi:dTDP-4-dehydrorhamnose 3,5-epimerase